MKKTPKSLRLQIGLFGRTNVGKSSFLNMVTGQDVSIISHIPGTTTDVVEKTMELLPLGPVVFLDTAGVDDVSDLSRLRLQKTEKIFSRSDVIVLITEAEKWSEFEEKIYEKSKEHNAPLIVAVNKTDIAPATDEFIKKIKLKTKNIINISSIDLKNRDSYVGLFKKNLMDVCPEDFLKPASLLGDLVKAGGTVIMIVPIDLQAPKGRLILPQVQAIRDTLDNDASALVVKEKEYLSALSSFKNPPDLVICDSQVVLRMVADTPKKIKCTTFSILFSRYKGDIVEAAKAAAVIESLRPKDKVLIAESCSHHAIEDDIGRVKIPRWIKQFAGGNIKIDITSGRDYPDNLEEYKLIIHCGACMLTRREMLFRMHLAEKKGVYVTNYGLCIAFLQGVLERVLEPFPAALDAYNNMHNKIWKEIKNGCVIKKR